MDSRNIPKLRFPGFTDEWEQRKLGDLSDSFEYGLNVAAKDFDGENKYIRITDIDDDTREFLQDDVTSPDADLSKADNYKLFEGDILFARTGASVGKSYIYKVSDGLVYYAGFLIRARIKEEYNPEFVFQNTLTRDYEKFITVTSMRSGQPGVNAQEYSQYEIMVPIKSEQDKISAYLRSLDTLITLHQRKYNDLRELKNGVIQKILAQKIRFKRSDGSEFEDWITKELSEIFTERKVNQTITEDAPLLSFTIEQGVINPQDKKTNKRDFLIKDKDAKKFALTEIDDIIYNPANLKYGAIHRNKLMRGVVSPIYAIFYTDQNPAFMEYVVKNSTFIKNSMKYLEGTVIKLMTLKPKDFLRLKVEIPASLEEQKIIADFLMQFDKTIDAEQRRIEKWKELKKGLLQRMFV